METITEYWKPVSMTFNPNQNDALEQQHHAAQFIALAGHYLIEQQSDDSNTNMEFIANGQLLAGHELANGLRLALGMNELKLFLIDRKGSIVHEISMAGKTKNQVFGEMKDMLSDSGIDVSNLKNELHYEIPAHELDDGELFRINYSSFFQENTDQRSNAEIVLNEIIRDYPKAESVRIWPHHFDTGSFIPVKYNENGELIMSIGLGFGIPDGMVDEPYFYLSLWSKEPVEEFENLPEPAAGEWIRTGWKGGVLKLSEILQAFTAEKQHQLTKSFFNSGIDILLKKYVTE